MPIAPLVASSRSPGEISRVPPVHHTSRGFRNPSPDGELRGLGAMLRWAWQRLRTRGLFASSAGTPPALVRHAARQPHGEADECAITWIGHSTFLVQVGGLNVLTDPVWSARCAPVQWAGPRRHAPPGVAFDQLPPIDVVLQSHDHYDHFDDWSVRAIARAHPQAQWYVPLGVGARLRARGVSVVTELDWWQTHEERSLHVTCVPAQHFSGRTPWDRNATLWGGFALRVGKYALYFVGDTGWHDSFGDIGTRCGPFDVVLMPIGAYDPRWIMQPVHVDPEEAVEAFTTLQSAHPMSASVMVAMHWGTFVLTDEPIDEPPVRARIAWDQAGLPTERLWVMSPGETRTLPR
jgi:N-acyl-phosphatidylethanolamine-hydrolysing phospholipase D